MYLSQWTKVFLENCHLGQKSPWTTVNMDKHTMNNCRLGQFPLGQLLEQLYPTSNGILDSVAQRPP